MSPWDIIGWAIILAAVGMFILGIIAASAKSVRHWFAYLKTRNVPPALGQEWQRLDGYSLYVDAVYDNGRIGVCSQPYGGRFAGVSASWGEDPAEFRRRTREDHYRLVRTDAPL